MTPFFLTGVRLGVAVAAASASLLAGAAESLETVGPGPDSRYLLGVGLSSAVSHVGSEGRNLDLQPVWAFHVGRFRLASGRAGSLMSIGRETVDAGLSTALIKHSDWSLSGALRWDGGRKSGRDPLLAGVPDVPRTLRGRLSVAYQLGPRWSWGASLSQDLLGRQGGAIFSSGVSYRYPVSVSTYWDASVGVSAGDTTYMQTHYGAASVGARSAYVLDAGSESVQIGWNLTTAFSSHWVGFVGVGVSQLQGGTRQSPLVSRPVGASAHMGVAYRCCE